MNKVIKSLMFMSIICISSSSLLGFFPFYKSSFHQDTENRENLTTTFYHHINQWPYIFPIIREYTFYADRQKALRGERLVCHDTPETIRYFDRRNIALWTIGLCATGATAWYKRDSIATGLEKLAAFIKKD